MPADSAKPIIVKNQVREDNNFKAYVNSEENARKLWKSKWGWILDEYAESRRKLDEKLKLYSRPDDKAKKQEPDTRTIRPIPDTVNHEYGWICIKPEFVLQKYGPDVDRGLPLPKEMFIPKQ